MSKVESILRDLSYPEARWKKPCLVALFGFPCAGKTTVAVDLSKRYPFIVLTTDALRLKYGFNSGPETLETMFQVTETLLGQSHSVIFDGIHMMRKNREQVRGFGAANNASVRFIHVSAHEDVIKQRLNQRAANPDATSQEGKFVITDEHFQRIISYYESTNGETDVIEVDTSSSTSPHDQLHSLHAELEMWLGHS